MNTISEIMNELSLQELSRFNHSERKRGFLGLKARNRSMAPFLPK